MNQQDLEKMIKDVILSMGGNGNSAPGNEPGKVTAADYPLGEKSADRIKTPTGKGINEVTLEGVLNGEVSEMDVRITPETLEMQAQVADSVGRTVFARNLRRAAELIAVPDKRILEIYGMLRPYRATKAELLSVADELENQYGCKLTAYHVREAAEIGEARGRLKKA